MPKQILMPNDAELDGLMALLKLTKLLADKNKQTPSALDLNFNLKNAQQVLKYHPNINLDDCVLGMQYLTKIDIPHHNYYVIKDQVPFENFCHYVETDNDTDMFIDAFGTKAFKKLINDIIDVVKTKFKLN